MNDTSKSKQSVNKRNIFTLWMIILVFGLPPFAAYFMYYTGIMPQARSNNGTLITPVDLPDLNLHSIDGNSFTTRSNKGKWTLLLLIEPTCDELCKKNIYLMRQVSKSLGKDRHNTERLLVITESPIADTLTDFLREFPAMPVITGTQTAINSLNQLLLTATGESLNKVFIIDPYGRVMMHYPQDLEPGDLLDDLKRLILVNSNDSQANIN